jgi:pSer/pThr/pTyr-binding forkhead associated (FHA) protein
MDGVVVAIWLLRLLFVALLYVFLAFVARSLLRDLRGAASSVGTEQARLTVIRSDGATPVGSSFPLDATATVGRDVNATVVLDDPFVSGEHARLTLRGRIWYVEDLESTNGTYLNDDRLTSPAPIRFGDELQVGTVRLRLDRPRQ